MPEAYATGTRIDPHSGKHTRVIQDWYLGQLENDSRVSRKADNHACVSRARWRFQKLVSEMDVKKSLKQPSKGSLGGREGRMEKQRERYEGGEVKARVVKG